MAIPPIAPYAMPTAEQLPASRVSWRADADRAVLLVHDMQRYFVRAFDSHAAPLPDVIAGIARLRDVARSAGVPVIYSAQPGDQDPISRGLLQDFWGSGPSDDPDDIAIIGELTPIPGELVLTKWRYSAFQRTDLRARLRDMGRDQLIITGIYTHIGCMATAADAFMQDVQPFLVADATADFSRREHLAALEWAAGRCARVVSVDDVVDGLRDAAQQRVPVGSAVSGATR